MDKYVDSITLKVTSGSGGHGSASFRREKYIPRGGPDGGDGGRGGDVIFKVNRSLTFLSHLYSRKEMLAKQGEDGRRRQRHGKDGSPIIIEIPSETILKDSLGHIIKKFSSGDEPFVFLKGGRGGRGNTHFASSVNRSPKYAEKGHPGKEVDIQLEVKIIADVGLVGQPNAGKSTFIATITRARPKIANYPFTTLSPHLGLLHLDITKKLIIADIPGVIEGAHQGKGLGIHFLKHIERTSFLFFIIDINNTPPFDTFEKLQYELKSFSSDLTKKEYAIGLSKTDTCEKDDIHQALMSFPEPLRKKIFPFSSLSNEGVENIKKHFYGVRNSQPTT